MKNNMPQIWDRVEKTIGGMKFAVILIVIFTVFMIVGTFLESYFGADFAQRTIYKKWPFILVQILMFLSICFAAFLRMPPKKRLYGFYTIHAGLIVIAAGATITYIAGIDGNILLHPNEPNRRIILNEDILRITFPDEGRQITRDLPFTAFPYNLNEEYEGIKFVTYLPYSNNELEWVEGYRDYTGNNIIHSSEYQIHNYQISEQFLLTLHPESIDYESTLSLGPLSVHYLPKMLSDCFTLPGPGFILWDADKQKCLAPTDEQVDLQTTSADNKFFVYEYNGELLTFFPDFSPWPLNDDFQVNRDAKVRLFNRNLFQDSPHLFLFGEAAAYYDGGKRSWVGKDLVENELVSLPWMDFQLRLTNHEPRLMPRSAPRYARPIMEEGVVVANDQQALLVEVEGQQYWVTDMRPVTLLIRGRKVTIEVGKKALTLPFEFVLTKFHMDTNPGTTTAASFESFVRLFTSDGPEEHHIYMNNPLKFQNFTFYQASYSENADGSYSSTLSANVDQGRPFKYFGSLMVVVGSMWHYALNRKRHFRKTPKRKEEDDYSKSFTGQAHKTELSGFKDEDSQSDSSSGVKS